MAGKERRVEGRGGISAATRPVTTGKDFCIRMGSDESHLQISFTVRIGAKSGQCQT